MDSYTKDTLLSLSKIHYRFHYTVMRYKIEGDPIKGLNDLFDLYDELNAIIYYDNFISTEVANSFGQVSKTKPIGFKSGDKSFIYVKGKWIQIITSLLKLNVYKEGEYVGFTKYLTNEPEFKLRRGIDFIEKNIRTKER